MQHMQCCSSTDEYHHLLLVCVAAGAGAVPWGQLVGVLSTDDALHDVDDSAETADRQPQVRTPTYTPQMNCSQHTLCR
jgi:hypothetical protein